ncbi:MAG: DNA polymerase III subunit gamma/tau [Clostridia bacterium]|nr:DNA polymerase III subunit gamma/tau [Clostridia bacterium]
MHQTLYRKWRPLTFDDVCGQEHVTSILRHQVENGKSSHAYLFCGSRGTGKTTCAKLLARALNCENPDHGNPCGVCDTCRGILSGAITDVIEMDAASNNGVDNIRDIREDVAYAPSECKKRIFIIDEVHMLSVSAFNALLKTLEEPPEHIVFILATTEMHKIPATILSRCQRYDFRRIESSVIVDRLRHIAENEQICIDDDALYLIAKLSLGGMRDAIGMLELCAGAAPTDGTPITAQSAAALLGTSPLEETAAVVEAICDRNFDAIFSQVDNVYRQARDIGVFWQSLISFYRDMLVIKSVPEPAVLLDLPEKQQMIPRGLAQRMTMAKLLYHTRILDEVAAVLQRNAAPARITVEMALVRMCDTNLDTSPDALLARISDLEDRLVLAGTAAFAAAAPTQAPIAQPAASVSAVPDEESAPWDIPGDDFPPIPDDAAFIPPPPMDEVPAPPPQKPQKKQAAPKASPAAPKPDPTPTPTEKKVLQGLRGWQEAVRKIERNNPIIGSFLREYKVYSCAQDGKLYLRAANAFSIKLVTTSDDNVMQICNAVNAVLGEPKYTPADLIFDSAEKHITDGYEMIDDLIEAAGDAAETAE